MSAASGESRAQSYRDFAKLGSGEPQDHFGFRVVVLILWRCLPLLRGVARPLVGLVAGYAVLWPCLFFLGTNFSNIAWNGVLGGQPITEVQAALTFIQYDLVAGPEPLLDAVRRTLVRNLAISVGLLALILIPANIALQYLEMWILQRINQQLRMQLMSRLQSLSLRFHAEQRVGDSIYRLFQDSAMVTQLLDVLVIKPLRQIATFVFAIAVVTAWDPRLALMLVLIWPVLLYIGNRFSRPLRIGFRAARQANSALTSRIQETASGIRVLKAYGAEPTECERFEDASLRAIETAYRARSRFVVYKTLSFYAVGLCLLAGVGWGTWLTAEGAELFGKRLWIALGFAVATSGAWNLGFYNSFKGRFSDGTSAGRDLMNLWGLVQDAAIGLDRVFELLDLEPETLDAKDAIPLESVEFGVAFRNVSFSYEPERPVLAGVDLEVSRGTVTAVVGSTGSGKSTLMALLLRLYDPDVGAIEIDGRDLRSFTGASLRERIGIALQENVLFGTTIRENIRYAVPDASDEQVRAAARVACADEFIEALPEGYDTLLGERGAKLSTGQRQRLSIARAIVKDTPILLLDEPTASLDAETEWQLLDNLRIWGAGRVILLVTHRLSTIDQADSVAVLSNGQLVEHGAPDELRTRPDGVYRRLVLAEESLERSLEGSEESTAGDAP